MQRQQRGGLELAEDEVAIARRPGQPDPTSVVGTPDRGTAAPRATVGYVPRPPGGLTIAPLWPPPAFGTIGASAAGGAGAGAGCARRRGRTSRYRGVSLKAGRKRNPWKAVITVHNQTKHLGYFASEELAAAACARCRRRAASQGALLLTLADRQLAASNTGPYPHVSPVRRGRPAMAPPLFLLAAGTTRWRVSTAARPTCGTRRPCTASCRPCSRPRACRTRSP